MPDQKDASVFARAAYYLDDYVSVYTSCVISDDGSAHDKECIKQREEMAELARRMKELDGEWESKQEAGTIASAARIVASMLIDWKLPGAVWYFPAAARWRVTGEDYAPQPTEVCVGVYAPGVSPLLLEEDFRAVAPDMN